MSDNRNITNITDCPNGGSIDSQDESPNLHTPETPPADVPGCSDDNNLDSLLESLNSHLPETPQIDMPVLTATPSEEKVSDANSKLEDAIANAFSKSEAERMEQQKPLLISIIALVAIQLLAFNYIIHLLVSKIITSTDTALITALLDFLKYYIGAVIVELVGLVVLVANTTFSMHPSKMLESIIQNRKK